MSTFSLLIRNPRTGGSRSCSLPSRPSIVVYFWNSSNLSLKTGSSSLLCGWILPSCRLSWSVCPKNCHCLGGFSDGSFSFCCCSWQISELHLTLCFGGYGCQGVSFRMNSCRFFCTTVFDNETLHLLRRRQLTALVWWEAAACKMSVVSGCQRGGRTECRCQKLVLQLLSTGYTGRSSFPLCYRSSTHSGMRIDRQSECHRRTPSRKWSATGILSWEFLSHGKKIVNAIGDSVRGQSWPFQQVFVRRILFILLTIGGHLLSRVTPWFRSNTGH